MPVFDLPSDDATPKPQAPNPSSAPSSQKVFTLPQAYEPSAGEREAVAPSFVTEVGHQLGRALGADPDVKKFVESAGTLADKAWDYSGAMLANVPVIIAARAHAAWNAPSDVDEGIKMQNGVMKATPEQIKRAEANAAAERRVNSEASRLAQEAIASHVMDPFTGEGHLFDFLGWRKSAQREKIETMNQPAVLFADNVVSLLSEAQDAGAKKLQQGSGGRVQAQEALDLFQIGASALMVHGVGAKKPEALAEKTPEKMVDDYHGDLDFLSNGILFKAAKGSTTPVKDAVKGFQWSNVDPELQKAMEEDILAGLNEAEKAQREKDLGRVPETHPGEPLRGVAEALSKDPEERTPEQAASLRKYFKGAEVAEEAKEALAAAMKPLGELTKREKELLTKYAPSAAAAAIGLGAWMTQDDSDPKKGLAVITPAMAVGMGPGLGLRRAVETLGELRETMEGPTLKVLETLPAETTHVTKQMVKQELNKGGIAGPERAIWDKVLESVPEGKKVPVKELLEKTGPALAEWALEPEEVPGHADYGLTEIDRLGPSKNKTVLWKTDGEKQPIRIPAKIEGEPSRAHFKDDNVFGFTRRFFDKGVKYIVEIQSDAFQKLARALKPGEERASPEAAKEALREETQRYEKQAQFSLTKSLVKLSDKELNPAAVKQGPQSDLRMLSSAYGDYWPSGAKAVNALSELIRTAQTHDSLVTVINQAKRHLAVLAKDAEEKLKNYDPEAKWQATSDRLRPMSKLFPRRLIREELAENARKLKTLKEDYARALANHDIPGFNEARVREYYEKAIEQASHVMIASADTVAKVEGWERFKDGMEKFAEEEGITPEEALDAARQGQLSAIKKLERQLEDVNLTAGDKARLEKMLRKEQARLQHLTKFAEAPEGEKPQFTDPAHEGLYKRYKDEIEPFVRSLRAEEVNDRVLNTEMEGDKDYRGHTWLKTPVENGRLGLGPRAHMAGFSDPYMMALLAGGTLGALVTYSYTQKSGSSVLGAVLGAAGGFMALRHFSGDFANSAVVKAAVRELSDTLYTVVQGAKADGLDMMNHIKTGHNEAYAKHAEEIANHLDNPKKYPLSAKGRELLDTLVRPIQEGNRAMMEALKSLGVRVEDVTPAEGARRFLKGTAKGWAAAVETLEAGGRVGGNRVLSTTVKGSTDAAFQRFTTPSGVSYVGKVGAGGVVDVYKNGQVIGKGTFDTKKQVMKFQDHEFKASRPTMDEVTQHTKLEYHKDPLVAELDANLRLRSALANAYALQRIKNMPGFSKFAIKPEPHEVVPEGWRAPKGLPVFKGWKFEPRIAEVIEDFVHDSSNEYLAGLQKINRILIGSMFWNPMLHIGNVAVHALHEKGTQGLMQNLPINLRTSMEAYREVSENGPKYRAYLRQGGSFMYPDRLLRDFTGQLMKSLGTDPKNGPLIARAFGELDPRKFFDRVYNASADSLWKWNDVMMMQGYLEKEARGMSRQEAMRQTEAHIPSYRIPSRVLDSRALSQILRSPLLSFARYDYGRLASYGAAIKDLVGKDSTLKDRAHAIDQFAMLGIIMIAYDQLGDNVAKWLTQNPNASAIRLGSATIPGMIMDAWSGEADARGPLANLFHLSPVIELAPQIAANTNLFTRQDLAKDPKEALSVAVGQLSPAKQVMDVTRDKNPKTWHEVLWAQLGIKDPTPEEVEKKEKRKQKRLAEREAK